MFSRLVSAAAILILLGTLSAHADDKAVLKARLDRVDALTRLDDPSLKPWYMKLSFQLYDDAGKPTEQGTLEEWWAGPAAYKLTITSPSYTATTIANKDGRFSTTGSKPAPYLLELLHRQMVHPMPMPNEVADLTPQAMKVENATGTVPECMMYNKQIRNVSYPQIGLLPTYCLVPDKDLLQVSYDYANLMVARTAMGMFQKKVMPIDINITLNRIQAASSHLLMLKVMPLTDADFAAPATGMQPVVTKNVDLKYNQLVLAQKDNIAPVLPPGANITLLDQPVDVRVHIGTDGKVHGIRLESTPDPLLAPAAMTAVQKWTFEPWLENGKPAEVDTVIGVHFVPLKKQGVINKNDSSKPKE